MEIGNKLNQLRKLSGMTQEQLAQKLAVSRQTISKWESDSTSPDLESIVKISKLFHVSLDDLLLEENTDALKENDGQISLEDLTKINLHHRKTTLLLMSGLIFIMVSILNFAYVTALERTTVSTQYMLYRYIVTGQYDNAPVNYMNLMIPSVIAGVIGLALFLCCLFHNNEKKHMFQIICIISCIAACVLAISLFFYGSKNKSTDYSAIYGATIGGLEDNELFAIIETNSSSPVLLVTSQVYEDGQGHQATLLCDVYYPIDGEVKNIGSIESFGTAYPISFDKTGIYTASGHTMQCFEIDEENGTLRLAEGAYEQFDENGNASYTLEKEGKAEEITEEEYYKVFEKYSEADVVNFSYGASGT